MDVSEASLRLFQPLHVSFGIEPEQLRFILEAVEHFLG